MATNSRISKHSERSQDSVSRNPDHASAVKKIEERYERFISTQRKERYNLGCDKSAKQAHTQTCQDVSLQIQLLEEGRGKELAKMDRQYRRATTSKSTPQQVPSQPPPQVCGSGSKIDFARDKKAIESALAASLDISEAQYMSFDEFKAITERHTECGRIDVEVNYIMRDLSQNGSGSPGPRIRNASLVKRNNKIYVDRIRK